MTEKTNVQNLLADCRNGDREAFESLYLLHQRRVFSVALNFFGGDDSPAKDITQQVFLKIFEKIREFRGDAEFTTWLYRMTINACIDEQRKRKRFFSIENFFGEFRVKKSVDDKFRQKQISVEVQKVVAKLKTEYRLPILLKYVEGLSYQEIADVLECSIGTVSSRLNRGHKLLAKDLKHLKGEI